MGSPMANEVLEESFEETLAQVESEFVMPPDPELPTPVDPERMQLQLYGTNLQALATLKAKCLDLTCDTKEGYEATRQMIGTFRTLRGRIEKRRKSLNQEHQDAIRFVNTHAKTLTNFVENLESPLKEKKLAVDEAKEREKRAAELAEQERLAAIEREKMAAQEAERVAAHAAEQQRLKEEADRLAAERAAWVAERQKVQDEQDERQRQEAAKSAAERASIDAERRRLLAEKAAIDAERLRVEHAERDRLAKIEAERLAAEQAECEKQQAAERERLRVEAMPDAEAMREFAAKLLDLVEDMPLVKTDPAKALMNRVHADLELIVNEIDSFNQ